MKCSFNRPAISLLAAINLVAAQPHHAQGKFKRFDVSPDTGDATIDLIDNGPSISCRMQNGKGRGKPKYCTSGSNFVTMVDADCPEDTHPSIFNNPNKGCFVASVVEGDTGKIFHVNSAGDVIETHTDEYPDEEHPPNEEDHRELYPLDTPIALRGSKATEPSPPLVPSEGRSLQTTPVIDVLVVYTQGAKQDAANYGDGPIEDLVDLAIAETNMAYEISGINARLNLIKLHEDDTNYSDDIGSTSMSSSLYHLTYQAGNSRDPDGKLDYIHDMRDEVGADMVALITTGAGCGIAWLGGSNPNAGNQFSVTKYSCATGYYSFGHELGHNIGAHHDRGTTSSCENYSNYNYGYRSPTGSYRSILSYSCATGQCDNNPGGSCTRRPFFSTPDPTRLWDGQPMGIGNTGIGETNNAKIINDRAALIAGLKTSTGPVTPGPTKSPTTPSPTNSPVTPSPTKFPTSAPTKSPTHPTEPPTNAPSPPPTTGQPSVSPTNEPTNSPTTAEPTNAPTTAFPTSHPTPAPTAACTSITFHKTCKNTNGCNWIKQGQTKCCKPNGVNRC